MTDKTPEAARFDRLSAFVLVPAVIFMIVSLYVRIRTDTDPLWAELATPLFFALLGARSVLRPAPPESRKANKAVGILLLVLSVVLVVLTVSNSQGAN
ncbi:MAG TPA: hypothetical protein VK391_02475 [Allosphingosinicella sp.]|nr:hypothetical protein [Allosphingosinicella sp.]